MIKHKEKQLSHEKKMQVRQMTKHKNDGCNGNRENKNQKTRNARKASRTNKK